MLKLLRALPIVFLGLFYVLPAAAKPPPRAKVEQRMKQVRHEILKNRVGLDDKKAAEVERVLDKHAAERKKVQAEQKRARQALKQLLDKDSNDQTAYKKALDQLIAAERKRTSVRDKEIDELRKLLTPKQQAKLLRELHQARGKLQRKMREYREKHGN